MKTGSLPSNPIPASAKRAARPRRHRCASRAVQCNRRLRRLPRSKPTIGNMRKGLGTSSSSEPAEYRLEFDTRRYFERSGLDPFYPSVSVVFTFEGGHLHVPLLLSAYGYTTYKGT